MARYILKKYLSENYYWILKSDENVKTIAKSSEAYESKQGAKDSITWTKQNASPNNLDDLT